MFSDRDKFRKGDIELRKEDIEELHYICPIDNLHSVLTDGILSHRRALKLSEHIDISDDAVQARRASVRVPRTDITKGKLALHRHAVLYLNSHNAMMYVRKDKHENLCVLRIHREILNRGDAMLSSENASTDAVRFFSVTTKDPLYSPRSADFLTMPRVPGYEEKGKKIRQAEVLLPYEIRSSYIGGIFVSCKNAENMVRAILNELNISLIITTHPSLFFYDRTRFVSLQPFEPLTPLTEEQLEAIDSSLPESDASKTDSELDSEPDSEEAGDEDGTKCYGRR